MATRTSPLETLSNIERALLSKTGCKFPTPRSLSVRALSINFPTCSSVSDLSVNTRHLESSAVLISKEGFSVVAPISMIVPSSTYGRMTSCCALLKRCISSMKRIVLWLVIPRRSRASRTMRRRSETPAATAEICSWWDRVIDVIIRANVVLPEPGGPQRIIDGTWSFWMLRLRARSGPRMCSCPRRSSSARGRMRVASGATLCISCSRWWSKSVIAFLKRKCKESLPIS